MLDQAAPYCLLQCCVHCTRHVTRPCQNLSPPRLFTANSCVKLQSFLGLINYLQPFICSLSTKTTFLYEQLAKWDWNPLTDAAFQCLKAWICQSLLNATLMYYDRSRPVIVQTDTSEYGLGAAFIQSGHSIVFTSKTLTDIEIHYANIERGVPVSVLQPQDFSHLPIWQTCHCAN